MEYKNYICVCLELNFKIYYLVPENVTIIKLFFSIIVMQQVITEK